MAHRSARIFIVLLALTISAGLMYWAFQDELALEQSRNSERQVMQLADSAAAAAGELRAVLQAYVAAGQGPEFWMSRSDAMTRDLQTTLAALEPPAADGTPGLAAEAMTRLIGADARARAFVRQGQERLAADVVFTECRNHIDAVLLQVAGARERAAADATSREAGLRREQIIILAAAIAVWLLVALALVPVPPVSRPLAPTKPTDAPPAGHAPRTPSPALPAQASVAERHRPQKVEAPKAPPAPDGPHLTEAARVCADFARTSDGGELVALLTRSADVIGARGLVVWARSADGTTLVPVAWSGYDARVIDTVGPLPVTSKNVTAEAFRDGASRATPGRANRLAALAVPLVGPAGPVGALSGELAPGRDVTADVSALAGIFAAQLATLIGSMPPAEDAAPAEAETESKTETETKAETEAGAEARAEADAEVAANEPEPEPDAKTEAPPTVVTAAPEADTGTPPEADVPVRDATD